MKGPAGRLRGAALEARDAQWLRLVDLGLSTGDVADRFGVSRQLVNRRLRLVKRARDAQRGPAGGDAAPAVVDPDESEGPAAGGRKKDEGPPLPWWLELTPLFPIGPFTPRSACPHRCRRCDGTGEVGSTSMDEAGRTIVKRVECPTCRGKPRVEPGSLLCCMVCSKSGMDDHPALQRDRRTDPAPEPRPKPPASDASGRTPKPRETRREARARRFHRAE